MNIPATWTGSGGHVLLEPWVPSQIRDGFAELITELEAVAPAGLANTRRAFRTRGQVGQQPQGTMTPSQLQVNAIDGLLNLRFELLVAAQLLRAGALTQIRPDTPDFDCHWGNYDFGVEVTTRARDEVGAALEQAMERALWDGPTVKVTLTRSGRLLFSESPAKIAAISDRIVAQISAAAAQCTTQPSFGDVPVPELGLTAKWHSDTGFSMPGARVVYESVMTFTAEEWQYHWAMATRQVQDTIEEKGSKTYSMPSIAVVDVSRLGETSRLLSGEAIEKYRGVLDQSRLGNLHGALLVRTTLTSRVIEPLCWRGDETALRAIGAVVLGEYGKPLVESPDGAAGSAS